MLTSAISFGSHAGIRVPSRPSSCIQVSNAVKLTDAQSQLVGWVFNRVRNRVHGRHGLGRMWWVTKDDGSNTCVLPLRPHCPLPPILQKTSSLPSPWGTRDSLPNRIANHLPCSRPSYRFSGLACVQPGSVAGIDDQDFW